MKTRINITIDNYLYRYAKDNNITISKLVNDNLFYLIEREMRLKKINEKEIEEKIKIASVKWTS